MQEQLALSAVTHRNSTLYPYNTAQQTLFDPTRKHALLFASCDGIADKPLQAQSSWIAYLQL